MNINKKLCRDGFYSDFFSQGVQVGNILTLAGQLGDRADWEIPESIKEQMENCYDNIQNFLKEFRASLDNVRGIFQARERIYGCKPIGTSALVSPDYRIEIKCIASL